MDEIRQNILREQEARKARLSSMLNTSFGENDKKNDEKEDEIEKEVKKSEIDEFNKAYSELFDDDSIEKAKHQIGDSHPKWPQLKWTDLGGGKFGWRTGTGRGKRAKVADNASSSNARGTASSSNGSTGGTASTGGTGQQADTKPKVSPNMQKLFDAYSINSNKYIDPNKMSIETTPKGNWAIKYDGKRVATIRSLDIDKEEFDDLGITIEIPNDEKETTDTTKTETTVDTLKLESKNGFKFKSDSNYRMRYNKREKAYEIWKEGDIYGTKTAMMSIKSDNENIGGDIIKYIQKKYPKKGSTISYLAVTYGF